MTTARDQMREKEKKKKKKKSLRRKEGHTCKSMQDEQIL
jgi:hypothetical protein